MALSDQHKSDSKSNKLRKNKCKFVVSAVPAGGLPPLGAAGSADWQWEIIYVATRTGGRFNTKIYRIGNPIVEIRRSYDRLISTTGFPILVRHLYIESGPWRIALYFISILVREPRDLVGHLGNINVLHTMNTDRPTLWHLSGIESGISKWWP